MSRIITLDVSDKGICWLREWQRTRSCGHWQNVPEYSDSYYQRWPVAEILYDSIFNFFWVIISEWLNRCAKVLILVENFDRDDLLAITGDHDTLKWPGKLSNWVKWLSYSGGQNILSNIFSEMVLSEFQKWYYQNILSNIFQSKSAELCRGDLDDRTERIPLKGSICQDLGVPADVYVVGQIHQGIDRGISLQSRHIVWVKQVTVHQISNDANHEYAL